MQRHFDEQMDDLLQKLLRMGSLAESMIQTAMRTLIERDESLCQEVGRKEQEVNDLQIEIDDRAVTLTALQQPVAADVRFLFMASRIATELERIGDQAVNVCQNSHHVLKASSLKPLFDLPLMAEVAEKMVRDSLDALVRKDCDLANQVFQDEKKVDAFRNQIFRVLLTYMMADPGTIERALALILISRNLEKVGDHATNVAEEVIYLVEGREVRHHREAKTRTNCVEMEE
ncbi:MAG TPA: phosphate signaling complex protein PhoU [Acidobacteriota bacterium]|nr:phosphate signaling complex protein PhoU [Acidobacteriota bacterium]